MASTYTPLGVELMATGENAGTWGTKTNTNLQLIEQISGGYKVQTLNTDGAGANTTTLTEDDGSTGATVATRVIIFGAVSPETISGNKIVTFPVGVENFYLIKNSTSGSYTVQLKAASGSGATVTWATDDKGWKLVYFDGVATNTGVYDVGFGAATSPGGSNTQVQFNNSGAFGGSANLTWDGSNLSIAAQGDLRLQDSTGGEYIAIQAPATVASNVTLTLPADDGDADQALVTNGSGVLSWTTISGGTSWQAVKTSTFTAVAGEGYFVNTTSGVITMNLPAGTLGNEISFADYAGTFDTYTFTIAANGSEKILGSTADLTVSVERAANTLVYTDSTQGWLLKNK
tara:strand:+ start:1679 stop:2713 length:1035 start_codon:yes stop_codon:yes gene_type:complete